MVVFFCPYIQGCWHKLTIHCHHQRSTLSSEETIELVSFQNELCHDNWKDSMKLRPHQLLCYPQLLEEHRPLQIEMNKVYTNSYFLISMKMKLLEVYCSCWAGFKKDLKQIKMFSIYLASKNWIY